MQSQNPKISIQLLDGRVMNAELYPEVAPISVANFIKLIEQNFFDGLCFHRVIPNFMIQGGGFTYDQSLGLVESKRKTNTIKGEFARNGIKNDLKHVRGVLSMARTNIPNSASSQFFICVAEVDSLDGNYAAFGKLIDEQSLNVAEDISVVKTFSKGGYDDIPVEPVIITTIKIIQ